MQNKNAVILGAGSYGEVFLNYLKEQGFNIVGFYDDNKDNKGKLVHNTPILGTFKDLLTNEVKNKIDCIFCPIGDNKIRTKYLKKLYDFGYEIPNFIHESVIYDKDCIQGKGIYLLPGVIIMPHAKIKDYVIVSMGSKIAHHTLLEKGVFISTGVNVGANITINEKAFLGISSTIMTGVSDIGKNTIVGCGAVVIKNVPPHHIVAGLPAKTLRVMETKEQSANKIIEEKPFKISVCNFNNLKKVKSYKKLLKTHFQNNIYYSYEYLIYFETKSDKLRYFVFEENEKPIVIMPFYIRSIKNSSYFDVITPYGYGGPLYNCDIDVNKLTKFWDLVDKWYLDNSVVSEFVRFSLTKNHINYSGTLIKSLLNVKGKVKSNEEDHWTSFSRKVRNNYRRALKSNIKFNIYRGEEITDNIISDFHNIYIETMKRNNAKEIYYFPKQFFESIIHSNPNSFSIALDYINNTAVSAELIIINNKTLYAFLGGTRAEYFSDRPNDFLRVEILKWAVKNKKNYYVLGGGQLDGDSLYKSKKMFFPKDEDTQFYTGRKIINKNVYRDLCLRNNVDFTDQNFNDDNCNDFFPAYRK